MNTIRIIVVILLFALVPARAKIFGQMAAGTKDSLLRKNSLYDILLNEGIDSVLKSLNLAREKVYLQTDTSIHTPPDPFLADAPGKVDFVMIRVEHLQNAQRVVGAIGNTENGEYSVFASGSIISYRKGVGDAKFSFTRIKKYQTIYADELQNEPSSFWDSTAKPILVTLGAVAVIALFFLVRG